MLLILCEKLCAIVLFVPNSPYINIKSEWERCVHSKSKCGSSRLFVQFWGSSKMWRTHNLWKWMQNSIWPHQNAISIQFNIIWIGMHFSIQARIQNLQIINSIKSKCDQAFICVNWKRNIWARPRCHLIFRC